MRLIETHAHIYAEQFKKDLPDTLDRAREAGIERVYMPNIDSESIDDMMKVELNNPGYCMAMMGLHPCSVKKGFEKELYLVEEWLDKRDFVAVGEIGTDLYWDKTFWDQQQEAFNIQCDLAVKHHLPVVIHCRDSIDETIALLEGRTDVPRGVFHCFTGTHEQAKRVIELGMVLGIGGVATFKNGGLEPLIKDIDLEKVVLETDSPYLAPVPHRGKRNEPSYIRLVCQKMAEIRGEAVEEIAETTSANADKLFGQV